MRLPFLLISSALVLPACATKAGDIGAAKEDAGESMDSSSEGGESSEEGGSSSGGGDSGLCKEDVDQDGVPVSEDNAPDYFNPDQLDHDGDGLGDGIDLCPTLSGDENNSADSDKDGVGNSCDRCRQTLSQYNEDAEITAVPFYLRVRNQPSSLDSDGDGIGDACDNCITVANCADFGPDNVHEIGDDVPYDDQDLCQADINGDMIGDACEGLEEPGAAGPVGFGESDDFDQDGLANVVDECPRFRVGEPISCDTDGDCPTARSCSPSGICGHVDTDADGVGDQCDSCSSVANPMQVVEGGAPGDDEDGDFVGAACEASQECSIRRSARPTAFYPVSAEGMCCTTLLAETTDGLQKLPSGAPLFDPDGAPIRLECSPAEEESGECRSLPLHVREAPGMLTLPAGCEAALADAGVSVADNVPLTSDDVGDLAEFYDYACTLPPLDQDFDGLADACDFCLFAFDPENQPYIDASGRLWADNGRYCNGEYSPDATCFE